MEDFSSRGKARCIIVHNHPIVREDLHETMIAEGADVVSVAQDLNHVGTAMPKIVVISGQLDDLAAEPRIAGWISHGASIVVVSGDTIDQADCPPGFFALEQPFSSDDVRRVLGLTGIL